MQEHYLTTLDAAILARRSPETIRNWERHGRLKAIRTVGGWRLYTKDAVLEAIAAGAPKGDEAA